MKSGHNFNMMLAVDVAWAIWRTLYGPYLQCPLDRGRLEFHRRQLHHRTPRSTVSDWHFTVQRRVRHHGHFYLETMQKTLSVSKLFVDDLIYVQVMGSLWRSDAGPRPALVVFNHLDFPEPYDMVMASYFQEHLVNWPVV